ncbi:hypothetical protein Cni_G26695 [Canna indica]|uniref:Uncharacterized protein n=1 Tax=Canna indica TaxID=4628 RepID=A0AAQ3L2N6_9LILI|nr:hypothetical protein Cni_G26695 [Canna indica]
MNGYSKMGASTDFFIATKSRSIDFPDPPKPSLPTQGPRHKELAAGPAAHDDRLSWRPHNKEEDGRERFGVTLSRSSSSASQRFASGSTALQAAVKRAFSMRKSSSVREGYWRIHDSTGDEDGDEGVVDEEHQHQQQVRYSSKKKKGKLIRACKRIFSF